MAPTPYYPKGLELDGYENAALGIEVIIATFFAVALLVGAVSWLVAARLPKYERGMVMWLVVTGIVHMVVEGTFALNPHFYKNTDPNMLLLELWKDYSKADSRYATKDAFVTTMETFTSFVLGPLCLIAAGGLLARCSWRWVLILAISVAQLYGTILYFATCWFEGSVHIRPEPLYFWFYYIFMNALWIVFPSWCILYAASRSAGATAKSDAGKSKRL